jgi:hypothetical protein
MRPLVRVNGRTPDIAGGAKYASNAYPDGQRLNEVQNVIHDAVLAYGCWSYLNGIAEAEKAICLNERSIGIGDLTRP